LVPLSNLWGNSTVLAIKYKLLQSTQLFAWMRKGSRTPHKVSFELSLHSLSHAQLFAELGKPR